MFDLAPFLAMLSKLSIPFGINLFDIIIVLIVIFYAYEGYVLGFVLAALDLLSFILSFIIALKFYHLIAILLINIFSLPIGFANAIGFLLLAFLSEVILSIVFRKLFRYIPSIRQTHPV